MREFTSIVFLPLVVGSVFLLIGLIAYIEVREIREMRHKLGRKNRIAGGDASQEK